MDVRTAKVFGYLHAAEQRAPASPGGSVEVSTAAIENADPHAAGTRTINRQGHAAVPVFGKVHRVVGGPVAKSWAHARRVLQIIGGVIAVVERHPHGNSDVGVDGFVAASLSTSSTIAVPPDIRGTMSDGAAGFELRIPVACPRAAGAERAALEIKYGRIVLAGVATAASRRTTPGRRAAARRAADRCPASCCPASCRS